MTVLRRTSIFLALSLLTTVAVTGGALLRSTDRAEGATPASATFEVKDEGTRSVNYTGEVPLGVAVEEDACIDDVTADIFELTIKGTTKSFYEDHTARLNAHIEWDPGAEAAVNDLLLLVRLKNGPTLGSSDGGVPEESVLIPNPPAGVYEIVTCNFANATPQPYKGDVSLTSLRKTDVPPLPKASNPRDLAFSPIVTVDPQRDVAEPSLRIDKAGNYYECGPFGASRAADYATKSEDNGDTFRVLGEPPEGRIAPGGGGDCDLSVAPVKNENGKYTLSYVGLEALANFSTSVSEDAGRTFNGTVSSQSVPLVDRQWIETVGKDEVYLFYNQIPFGGTLQRSDNSGLSYQPASEPGNAAPDINRPGNLVIDPRRSRNPDNEPNETVYITYTNGLKVMVSRSTDQGQTFEQHRVATGKGRPDQLFPSITIDPQGNLYVAWIEAGSYNVFYSYSKDQGETWSRKRLVNRRGASTNVMPWIVVGSPGRIAVSFYCTPVDGDPSTAAFHAPWNVCVNQSLNALSDSPDFSQVKVASHPIHWDSICLSGLGCNVSNPPGDRTLLDFFQIRMDPRDGRVSVVYNESNKRPRVDKLGLIAIVTFSQQKTGPSLLRRVGKVRPDRRANVRSRSIDRRGDAKFDFSSLGPPEPSRENQPALDIQSLEVSKSSIGDKKALKFTMKMKALSDSALTAAALNLDSKELKFVVRWFSGYRPDYLTADWTPGRGFQFGAGHLKQERDELTADSKLQIYPSPGRKRFPGRVSREKGTITFKVPYTFIQDFDLGRNLKARPTIDHLRRGDKIYEVTAWTFGRPNATGAAADYYNQADSTPSFDYRAR